VEEHSILGGLGDTVASAIIGKGVEKFRKIGINDEFGQSGKPLDLLKEYGLTGPQIAETILKDL
jgi:transketolase